jgi:hypothetical protein
MKKINCVYYFNAPHIRAKAGLAVKTFKITCVSGK